MSQELEAINRIAQTQAYQRAMQKHNNSMRKTVAGIRNGVEINRLAGDNTGAQMYSGSDSTGIHSDFLGDWRSGNSWLRFDLLRIRTRSRQLERGNHWCRSFKQSLLNNVVGHNGFHRKPVVNSSAAYGDASEGSPDKAAQVMIKDLCKEFGKKENFTSSKQYTETSADNYVVSRLAFDGEVIIQKIKKFPGNEFGFTWRFVDPDYLDHHLNKTLPNGNVIRMGVELDAQFRYPVGYWFLNRRPNDDYWNYAQSFPDLHHRVAVEEIIHIFINTEDSEMVRGIPWLFSACTNLHKMGKFEEAALINATIGASKMGFFKKMFPTGHSGDASELEDDGSIIDECRPGEWQELPWGVEPVPWTPQYPDEEMESFHKVMMRGVASSLGMSYMSLTGDVTDANFSNLRAAKADEQENWKAIQQFIIEEWKEPAHEELVFRSMLSRNLNLPLAKIDKFKGVEFTGRRWAYVNPVDDLNARKIALEIGSITISEVIRETGRDPEKVFADTKTEKELLEKLDIVPIFMQAKSKDNNFDSSGNVIEGGKPAEGESERGDGADKSSKKK